MISIKVFLLVFLSVVQLRARKPLYRAARDAQKTGMYIVLLDSKVDHDSYQRIVDKGAALSDDKRAYGKIETVEKAFTLKLNPLTLEVIRSWPEVNHVEEEQMVSGSQDPTVPWHLDRIDQPDPLRDWQYSPQDRGEGVDVYILDTGINYDHDQFERRARYGGFDPVDDYYGDPPRYGKDCQGHGSHVASLVGGKTYGTANRVNLYSIRVLDCNNFAPWSIVLEGMDYVAKQVKERRRPMVVVMSLGGSYQPAANEAIKALHDLGVVVVVAAGNGNVDSCRLSPASSPYAITVAGSNSSDGLYSIGPGTNYGRCITIFAPGEDILGANFSCNNCSMYLSGTSMSTPLVAGVAAMYLHKQPLLTPDEVKEKLINESLQNVLDFAYFSDEAKETTSNYLLQTPGGCGGTYRYRTHFNISSPSYPDGYPPSQICLWRIIGDPGEEITFTLLDFDLEEGYDQLLICDGQSCLYDNIKANYTGNISYSTDQPTTYHSSSRYLSILLRTDSSGSGRGFIGTFTKFYKGTSLIAYDSGQYMYSSHAPKPSSTARVQPILRVRADVAQEVISNWVTLGYDISWIDTHLDRGTGVWLYDLLLHNSTLFVTRGYIELTLAKLQELIKLEKENGLILDMITSRLDTDKEHLFAVVFKKHSSHLIESHSIFAEDLYESVLIRNKLKEAGWTMVCHHVVSGDSGVRVSAVFHRDKRRRYGITEGVHSPKTLVYFGFSFFQFTSITLAFGVQDYYPRYVSAYYSKGETEARLSVIYEERNPELTFYTWFRWGLNATEVVREIDYFSNSWSPVMLANYVYNDEIGYMVVWSNKIE